MTTSPLTTAQAEQLNEQLRTAGLPPRRAFALHLVVTGGRKPALIPWPVTYDIGSPTAVVDWLADSAGDLAVPTVQRPVAVGCLVVGRRPPGTGMHLTVLVRPDGLPVSGLAEPGEPLRFTYDSDTELVRAMRRLCAALVAAGLLGAA